MSTPGLSISHVSPSQSNKIPAINSAADILDGALTQQSIIDVSGGADITPSPSTVLPFMCLRLIGVLTASIHLILPASGHLYMVVHAATGGLSVTVRCGGGSTVTLNAGDLRMVFCDGTNVVAPN